MEKAPFQFRIFADSVQVDLDIPRAQMRLDQILPSLRAIHDEFASAAVRRNAKPVTCAKGCSACCRIQPVPITPVEAYALLLLVEQLPEARQSEIEARFASCEVRLQDAGLAGGFLAGSRPASPEEGQAQARQYLDLALSCPFLDDDACSIYAVRPFACREYLVTTPKAFCTDPLSQPVQTVPGIPDAAVANLHTSAAFMEEPLYTIPLTLALHYARAHREPLARLYNGNQIFTRSINEFFQVAASQQSL